MTRRKFVEAYTASCMRRLEANDSGSPAEMAVAMARYQANALKLWRRLIPGVRSMTIPALEELMSLAEHNRRVAIRDEPCPWCEACHGYHHPADPTCFLLTRPKEVIIR